ncbi:hypothetical protein MAPG_08565 [Magnaporthiopsis poae ATCC 64411]|uniref:Uncharacterized protein n=1 Tax=Magnaporthiopsis poae (strain ATCC 64411 / 73-15) TaxID=644358 RepID=A0A0C4E7P6_MAGP6|nr:hypothetical protein MAPG_08565 [Magnaporthiopsis poae ATCC 64411]
MSKQLAYHCIRSFYRAAHLLKHEHVIRYRGEEKEKSRPTVPEIGEAASWPRGSVDQWHLQTGEWRGQTAALTAFGGSHGPVLAEGLDFRGLPSAAGAHALIPFFAFPIPAKTGDFAEVDQNWEPKEQTPCLAAIAVLEIIDERKQPPPAQQRGSPSR